eukprot:Blabericola_migrator_1__12459@NODE_786_length_6534_cov_13_057214_g556_i0_p2_GENE_NODE_786_length_6534_cov_13_057214_g556_i0NODE_786_length_6534_cov_13_057214_g556_i0_p2_ORF_typecomplete_len177_score16_39DUF2920/PF11144_8/0_11_NODE_786_length_6534_cov_13_057214_g556_i027283258
MSYLHAPFRSTGQITRVSTDFNLLETSVKVAPSDSKGSLIAEGTFLAGKPRCNIPYCPRGSLATTLTDKDRLLEDPFAAFEDPATDGIDWHCNVLEPTQHPAHADFAKTAQQHIASAYTAARVSCRLHCMSFHHHSGATLSAGKAVGTVNQRVVMAKSRFFGVLSQSPHHSHHFNV